MSLSDQPVDIHPSPSFVSLPPEIRVRVYRLLFLDEVISWPCSRTLTDEERWLMQAGRISYMKWDEDSETGEYFKTAGNIVRSCRLCRDEASPMFHSMVTLRLGLDNVEILRSSMQTYDFHRFETVVIDGVPGKDDDDEDAEAKETDQLLQNFKSIKQLRFVEDLEIPLFVPQNSIRRRDDVLRCVSQRFAADQFSYRDTARCAFLATQGRRGNHGKAGASCSVSLEYNIAQLAIEAGSVNEDFEESTWNRGWFGLRYGETR